MIQGAEMLRIVLMLAVWTVGFAALNYLALRNWRSVWRKLGWIPTVILSVWDLSLVVAIARDSTSHNLWPIEAIGLTIVSLIVLACIAIAHDIDTRRNRARGQND